MAATREVPKTPRFRIPNTPLASNGATPGLTINNDEIEKRTRTRENRIRTVVSPGCHTPRSVVRNPDGARTLESGTSTFSNAQIAEHYKICVKLSTENKINAKNAFGLHLIDYMAEMLRKRGEMTNFQVAGCTLDASAKIYAGRVDSIYNDAYKMLGGLGRSDKQGDGEEEREEGEEGETVQTAPTRKKTRKTAQVIEKNSKSLDVNTFDLEFEVDPLFKKTSAAFDEGGVAGLLLNQLSVESDNSLLMLDATHKLSLVDRPPPQSNYQPLPTTATNELLTYLKAIKQFESLQICRTFANFKFNKDTTESTEDPINLGHADYCPPVEQPDYSGLDFAPPTYDSDNDDDIHVEGGASPVHAQNECDEVCNVTSPRQPLRENNTTGNTTGNSMGPLKGVGIGVTTDTIEVSEYSYFNPNIMSGWIGGPDHWKLFSLPGHHQSTTTTTSNKDNELRKTVQKKRRQERVIFRVDFTSSILQELFTAGKASTVMSKKLLERMNSTQCLLPHAPSTDRFVLHQLFCKEKLKVHRTQRMDDAYQLSDAGDLYNDDSALDPPVYDDDHYDDDVPSEYDPTKLSGAQFMSMLNDDGMCLIDEPQKVAQIGIDYAKQAKKIDVKRLKGIMWNTITKYTQQSQDRTTPTLSFSTVYNDVKTNGPSSLTSELSIHISFVCLLHLANEKSLTIAKREDMADFMLAQ